ncbi:MAG: hypothetical protein AAB425_02335 [Bdellovibrionota bacterium]
MRTKSVSKPVLSLYLGLATAVVISAPRVSVAGAAENQVGEASHGNSTAACAKSLASAKAEYVAVALAIEKAKNATEIYYNPILARTAAAVMASDRGAEALAGQRRITEEVNATDGDSTKVDWESVRADAEYHAGLMATEVVRKGPGPMAKVCQSGDQVEAFRTDAPGAEVSCKNVFDPEVQSVAMAFGRYIEYSVDPGIPELRLKEIRTVPVGPAHIFKKNRDQVEIVSESFLSLPAGNGIDSQTSIKVKGADGKVHILYGFGGFEHEFVEARIRARCASEIGQLAQTQSTSDVQAMKNVETSSGQSLALESETEVITEVVH